MAAAQARRREALHCGTARRSRHNVPLPVAAIDNDGAKPRHHGFGHHPCAQKCGCDLVSAAIGHRPGPFGSRAAGLVIDINSRRAEIFRRGADKGLRRTWRPEDRECAFAWRAACGSVHRRRQNHECPKRHGRPWQILPFHSRVGVALQRQ